MGSHWSELMGTFHSKEDTLLQRAEREVFKVKREHFQVRNSHLVILFRRIYKSSLTPLLKPKPPSPHRTWVAASFSMPSVWAHGCELEGHKDDTGAWWTWACKSISKRTAVSGPLLQDTSCHFRASEWSGFFLLGQGPDEDGAQGLINAKQAH